MYHRTDDGSRPRVTRWAVSVAAITLLTAVMASPTVASAAASAPKLVYTGSAFGTELTLAGGVVKSGKSAPVVLPCNSKAGISRMNSIASVSVPLALSTGTVSTSATTSSSGGTMTSQTTAATQQVSLLQGMITADAVQASSATSYSSAGFQTSAAGSGFVNLVVAGQAQSAAPPANTKIPLPNVGYVILNQQSVSANGQALGVAMIHVVFTVSGPMGNVGTQIIVSYALSDLEGPVAARLDGTAYGSSVNVANVVTSGPSAEVWVPCLGTSGRVHTDTTAGINVPLVLSSGTISNTAQGTATASGGSAQTTSKIQAINIALGLVKADVVQADAHASETGAGPPTFSDAGSNFVNLVVQGHVVNPAVPANTMMSIPGVGTLWLHRVIQGKNSIEVRMIELIVTDASNPLGLAAGLDVRLADAEASVHPAT